MIRTYSSADRAAVDIASLIQSFRNSFPEKPCSVVFDIDDTLFHYPRDHAKEHEPIVDLCRALTKIDGCKVHLVTAREDNPEMVAATQSELQNFGLQYSTLDFCPRKSRDSRMKIAKFKQSMREKYSQTNGVPHVLTIGDQWSDLFVPDRDTAFDRWDRVVPKHRPVALVEIKDPTAAYGLKLKAFY